MDNLPKFQPAWIAEHKKEVSDCVKDDGLASWFNDELSKLKIEDEVLYQYITDRSQSLAKNITQQSNLLGVAVVGGFELVVLLRLIDGAIGKDEALQHLNKRIDGLWKDGEIDGLEGFGK